MTDQTLVCQQCKSQFVFSAGEQQFYKTKNLLPPIYCPICRSVKRQESLHPKKPK